MQSLLLGTSKKAVIDMVTGAVRQIPGRLREKCFFVYFGFGVIEYI